MPILDGYIRKEELAAELGGTKRTLDRWHTGRIGPPRVRIGKTILFDRKSVLEWLARRERKPSERY